MVPSVNAEKIRWPTFSVVRRGFDQKEVLEYSAQVADMVRVLDDEVQRLRLAAVHPEASEGEPFVDDPAADAGEAEERSGPEESIWASAEPIAKVDTEKIRRPAFAVVRRGFDRQEVLEYSAQVSDMLQILKQEIQRLRPDGQRTDPPPAEIANDVTQQDDVTPQEDVTPKEAATENVGTDVDAVDFAAVDVGHVDGAGDPYQGLASHVAEVLRAMDRDVQTLRQEAESEAESLRREAESEAESLRREAESEAEARLRDAEAAAETRLREAATEAESMLSAAKAEADQRTAEAAAAEEAARVAATASIERADAISAQLASRRDKILEELTTLCNRLLNMVGEMAQEAERVGEQTVIPLEDLADADPVSVSAGAAAATNVADPDGQRDVNGTGAS
jgi:cell division septum initiation protein DivIVA